MRNIVTLALKDLLLLWRDKMGLFFVIGFPLLMAMLFGAMFQGAIDRASRKMKVVVVDEDRSEASRKFADKLAGSKALEVIRAERQPAHDLVRQGKRVAYIVLPKGYGEAAGTMFGGQAPRIEVGIDPSRLAESGILEGLLMEETFRGIQAQFSDPQRMRAQIGASLKEIESDTQMPASQKLVLRGFLSAVNTFLTNVDPQLYKSGPAWEGAEISITRVAREGVRPASAFEISFPSAMLWGLIGSAAGFAITIVRERVHGTFQRLRVAPITRAQILAGKGLGCFAACICVMVLLTLIGMIPVFGLRVSNPLTLVMGVVSTALCFVGLMMLLSVLGKTEQSVSGAGWAVLTVMAMFGGGMVPLIFMPEWMLWIGSISPVKWGIWVLEGALWRGFSVREMLPYCGILLGIGTACFLGGWRIFARREM